MIKVFEHTTQYDEELLISSKIIKKHYVTEKIHNNQLIL